MPERAREELFMKVNDIRPANWIIEGLAMEQGLTILFGDKGAGKTTLSMQILNALKNGQKLFCLETQPVSAFIVEQDEPPRIFRNHRDRIIRALPQLEELEIPKVFVTWDGEKQDFNNLVELIQKFPAKLVIIDSFTSLGIPDINHPNTSAVIDRLRQINAEHDVSFILLHHVNRKGSILGSITLQIKADNIAELNNQGLKFHKTRGEINSFQGDMLPIQRQSGGILFRLPMAQRARTLLDNPDALDVLQVEYPESTRESIRVTLSEARRNPQGIVYRTADARPTRRRK